MTEPQGRTWVRFRQQGQICWGQLVQDAIHVCVGSPLDLEHRCGARCGTERLPLEGTPLLPPCEPTKIVCVGRNYAAHAQELGNRADVGAPQFFLKPPSSLLAPGGTIELPPESGRVDYEGELGVVIRRRCRRLAPGADPRPYVLGFTCVNDVTARDLQRTDVQWTRAKGFDTFCPCGPWATEVEGEGEAWGRGLQVETWVNGEVRQSGNTRDCIFSVLEILRAVTAVMTLEPGDLVATGTPAGVGGLHVGDRVRVEIAGVGRLENAVVGTPAA